MTFWAENQSFWNKSGKTQPIWTKFGYVDMSSGDNDQVILSVIGPFWAKWGLGQVLRERKFFCVVNQTTFRQLRNGRFPPNLVRKHISVPRRGIRKNIFKNFHFRGHLPPKSEIKNWSNRHLTQSRLQGSTAERYCLLHVVVQGSRSFRVRSTFLYDVRLLSYGASNCPIFGFWPIFPYKTPKTYLLVTSLQLRGYIAK